MGLIDALRRTDRTDTTTTQLREALAGSDATIELLQENLAQLELAMEDVGWQRMLLEGELEFSRDGLQRIIGLSRLMAIKNPLIRRAVRVQAFYVWGQGVEISHDEPAANEVIQRFLDDPGNRAEIFGHQAAVEKEKTLQTDGTIPLVLVPHRTSGHVQVRSVPVDEIQDVIRNPDDRREPWYYERRRPTGGGVDAKGRRARVGYETVYHPDWRWEGGTGARPTSIDGHQIIWDQPIYWIQVGGNDHMRFGVPETYSALDWARAHKDFLEDWASMVRALSRFAWKMTGSKRARDSARQRLGTTLSTDQTETNPPPGTGSVAFMPEGSDLTPIPKTGATVDSDDGRQLRLMVAAGVDLPDTMLANDPQQGALATAKSLDRPTELGFLDRQQLWAEVRRDLIEYQLRWWIRHGKAGPRLPARVEPDPVTGVDRIVWNEGVRGSVKIEFPPILERDLAETIKAIVTAATLDGKAEAGTMPSSTLVRMLLVALGVADVDEQVEELEAALADEDDEPDEPVRPTEEALVEVLAELAEAVGAG